MEIKNCSIYPRYEEFLPKISRIPEFALFMYHRHGKSNRVKCLPHSNGQALRGGGHSDAISLPDLALELTDPGFDFSVLCEFRTRLIDGGNEYLLFEAVLERLMER